MTEHHHMWGLHGGEVADRDTAREERGTAGASALSQTARAAGRSRLRSPHVRSRRMPGTPLRLSGWAGSAPPAGPSRSGIPEPLCAR
jgi:hypothetical protein